MADANKAIEKILIHEGGYVNDPRDVGGETNWGISKRQYPTLDIRNLTRDEAIVIYRRDYWFPLYDQIANQKIANGLFDFGVNAGIEQAVRVLQRALNDVISGPVVIDGIFGPATLAAVNASDPDKLMMRFNVRRITYYAKLNRPEYIMGWVSRTLDA